MTAHVNLLRDGYEEVAEHVSRIIRKCRGSHAVVVRDTGAVCVYTKYERLPEREAACLIGTYNRKARVNEIEDDLIVRLKELSR